MLTLSCCLILATFLKAAAQEDANTVFVRENGTAELKWSLFIGENAGRSSVNVMIKRRDALLCQWVKAHWEINQCDPGMNLTISPKDVRVPGPTYITVTFSFKNKGRSDDGTYECRFVIDEKWQDMQMYPRYLVTTVEPVVSLNATYSNTCITDIICHVRGGRPKPVETILIKNGTEISRSRLKWQEEARDTDGDEASQCSSVHSIENSGGQLKCRVVHAGHFFDSAEVDIPFGRKENETRALLPVRNDYDCTVYITLVCVGLMVITMLALSLIMLTLKIRRRLTSCGRATNVSRSKREMEQFRAHFKRAPDIEENESSISGIQVTDDQEEPDQLRIDKLTETAS